ncbi:Hypothetical_protein [Hexamita inflata]|uniref:Hypothetical_protein n=1 Tax=Hexamita inflata TaxID=28002 RepID=A0ABP1JIH6_9EUKA
MRQYKSQAKCSTLQQIWMTYYLRSKMAKIHKKPQIWFKKKLDNWAYSSAIPIYFLFFKQNYKLLRFNYAEVYPATLNSNGRIGQFLQNWSGQQQYIITYQLFKLIQQIFIINSSQTTSIIHQD